MNAAAFRRSEAIEKLEAYAPVIVEHLALITWFPKESSIKHWNAEIEAFGKTLKRYNHGKKRPHNFKAEDVVEILLDEMSDNQSKDSILISIEGHGVKSPTNPDWGTLEISISVFASQLF